MNDIDVNSISPAQAPTHRGAFRVFFSPSVIIFSIIAIAIGWLIPMQPAHHPHYVESSNITLLRHVTEIVFIYGGGLIGDVLRRIAMPDAFFSTGFLDTLKQKLFWAVGPQAVGCGVGLYLAYQLVLQFIH